MTLGATFGAALTTSEMSATDLVPSIFPVALGGFPYTLDLNNPSGGNFFRCDSIALLRTQADNARTAGESSVSPEIFWRRSFDSWHLGQGQTNADRDTSSPYRFRSSKGMDVWSKGQLKSLNNTEVQNPETANANVGLVAAGSRLYTFNGNTTYFTTSTSGTWSWTTVTGTPANEPAGIVSDGLNVWIAHTDAIWKTNTTISTAASFTNAPAGTWTGIWFNKGKLFGSISTGKMYEISGAGVATLVSGADRSTLGFTWTASAGVGGSHYFAGYNGDKSLIFKSALSADGVALSALVVAGELPDGENVLHLGSYLGYLIIGTSKGVRFASANTSPDSGSNGYITIGGLIQTGQPVYASEGQDRFVWFGWGNYDANSSGLGRMDLSEFTAPLTPAYASDLMAGWPSLSTNSETPIAANPILGDVKYVVTYNDKRVFAIAGKGVFAEATTKVYQATLSTGLISHGIIDNKFAAFLDARLEPFVAGSKMQLSHASNSGAFTVTGAVTEVDATYSGEFYIGGSGSTFETKVTFGDITPATLLTADVTCTGFMLRSYPAPKRVSKFTVPIALFDNVSVKDRDFAGDPSKDFQYLYGLHQLQLPFTYQEGDISYTVVMDDYQWLPEKVSSISGFQGTFVAVLREIL
jgi:hypothetical protein